MAFFKKENEKTLITTLHGWNTLKNTDIVVAKQSVSLKDVHNFNWRIADLRLSRQ